ncbi:hypothetical protein [Halosimplex pelagicum]|uniref:Uncharacterized protein n=1 Tax=Halosimplex pelagicum TaxID=869886 RepID=A0A7D5PCV6_9EURY|nr:hypothetical protein [Halosimplex pelagicum]QLH83785.1 hypothetical protein HZS54_20075 [Halosimplex pelagicum]
MLNESEKEFIELVLTAGDKALEQDTFELMIEEGVPAEPFINSTWDYTLGEVMDSLAEKGLAYTESQEETIHYNGGLRGKEIEPIKWENTGFKTVDRQYIYFTEKLEELYQE